MIRRIALPGAARGTRRALVALALLLGLAAAAIVGVAASGSADGGSAGAASASGSRAASDVVATRWWSVPGAARGSRIDAADPGSVAARLTPSRAAYCTVLRQTVASGQSLLPDGSADDPALAVTAKAFVGELGALAPSDVHDAWRTMGSAVLALVATKGRLQTVDRSATAGLGAASQRIAADAGTACHVDLAAHPSTGR